MIAFDVSINGKRICTAGMEELGVLSADLFWSRRQPQNIPEGESSESINFHVGGLHATMDEHVDWLKLYQLQIGDTVSIHVVETDKADVPVDRRISRRAGRAKG